MGSKSLGYSSKNGFAVNTFLFILNGKKDRIIALCHDDIKFANGLNSLVPELIMPTFF